MSRLDPLLDALKKTDSDELRVFVGECICLIKAGSRRDVGREPVQPQSVSALAGEVLTPEQIDAARVSPQSIQLERGGSTFELVFAQANGGLSISIAQRRGGAEPAAAAQPASSPAPLSGTPDFAPPPASQAPARAAPPAPAPAAVSSPAVPAPAAAVASALPPTRGGRNAIDEILSLMIARKASDLHLSTGAVPILRVHGEMTFLRDRPILSSDDVHALLKPLFTGKTKDDFDARNDADFAYEIPGLARFRVNAFRDRNGIGAVLRQIPIEIIPAEKLGLPQAVLDLCWLSKGLVVVTGPTGSGKSTTLAGMIDYINKNRSDHIITIEDPVEFVHKNIKCLVNQREVGRHTQSFKAALRAALREDPDIVLVGEMRDLETISIAIETAETGHLVFGTLHTTTAISTVDRIIDQFPTDQQEQIRVMLSESLKGVVAQVLCKKVGGGRVAAMEILLGSSAVSSLVREGKTFQIPSVMQTSRGAGMVTMNDALMALVEKKQVDPKEAYVKSVDKPGLLQMFKSAGIRSPV